MGLKTWMERVWRIWRQLPHDSIKLHALHAPEVECIGKGKARQPFEFGVKVSLAVTHKSGLIAGARSFPGHPYDGHTLAGQIKQTTTLLQDIGEALLAEGQRGSCAVAVLCAAGFNIHWLLRAIARDGVAARLLALMALRLLEARASITAQTAGARLNGAAAV